MDKGERIAEGLRKPMQGESRAEHKARIASFEEEMRKAIQRSEARQAKRD